MLIYPQLSSGALCQFPIRRRHQFRTLTNTAADGTAIKLADPGAEVVEWQLDYSGLSDEELRGMMQFFADAEGSLNSFTFVDPTANMLAWSGDLGNADWVTGPFLTITGGGADPASGMNAWRVVNTGAGAQSISKTVTAPGGYVYCFSAYARPAGAATVTLLAGSSRYERALAPGWQRVACTATPDAALSSVTFGIELPAGAALDVYGIQAEPQASPSVYKATTRSGCYENARLRDDALIFSTLGPNCHSATVNILYANHL